MMREALPQIKTFCRLLPFPERARALVTCCMAAFITHVGKMSARQAAGAVRSHARHRAQITRMLLRHYWTADVLRAAQRAVLHLESCRGEYVFIVDQTYIGQQGRKTENTFSRANHRSRPKKGRRRQKKYARRSCHGFVCGLLITPTGLRVPSLRSYYTRTYSADRGVAYRTQTDLAADLIRELPVAGGASVVVLGDTAFEAQSIRRACAARGFSWVVPLNPERVLAGPRGKRPKGASLVEGLKGTRLTRVEVHPQRGPHVALRRPALCRQGPRTEARTYYVHGERRQVHNVGDVLLVFSTTRVNDRQQPQAIQKILMTDARHGSAADVVRKYQLRWQIELFFKELKSTLGLAHYRLRRFAAVESWVKVVLLTFLYLEWYRGRPLARRGLPQAARRWWQAQRCHGLCHAVRQKAEDQEVEALAKALQTPGGIQRLRKLLKDCHPKEYRLVG